MPKTLSPAADSLHNALNPAPQAVVVMGVSGSGKSTAGQRLAEQLSWQFIEGDTFHSPANHKKMHAGIPLTDDDRASWLDALGAQLRLHAGPGVVLSCSALKQRYRDRLRSCVPNLAFVWLDIGREAAATRVASRGALHFFPAALIDSQFQALEPPSNEPGMLRIDADLPLDEIIPTAVRWLAHRQLKT
ncbi:gluconokinase [Allopusillimonas ginsengisoli]|nr:gluconokinase [Allopusillimonas ginsengisoli]